MSQTQNITIDQGSEFKFRAQLLYTVPDGCTSNCSTLPVDLTNKGIRGQMRSSYDACLAVEFTGTIIDPANGKFELSLTALQTETLKAPSTYVWDCEVFDLTDTGDVFRPFSGSATVTPEVTK